MAKIPSAQDINRQVPQYGRPIVGLTPDPSGRALQQFGEGIARAGFSMADEEKRNREQEELAYAESEFLRRQAETMNELAENPNYDTYNDIYNKSASEALKASSGMISDSRTRSLFAAKLAPRIETTRGSVMDMARRKRGEVSLARSLELTDASLSARRGATDPVTKSALLRQAETAIDANVNDGFLDPVRAYNQKKDLYERAALDDFEDAPLTDKINAVKYARGEYAPEGGFDGAYKLVAENEGGFTPSDGASGAPAIFGINRKWFPTEFDEVKELYAAGKVDEAKALAQRFYKQEFWDKNKLDRFDAATQAVLFDGAINHRAEFTKELIKAADDGATPSELIKMREREYMRLGSKPEYAPSLGGWLNRLENVKKHTGDAYEYFKALPVEKQSALGRVAEAQYAAEEMRFAPPQRRAEIANQFQDNPAVMDEYKRTQEAIKKDPAAYVAVAPNVMAAQEAFAQEPNEENRAAYLDAVKQTQRQIGVPDSKVRYISKAQADEFKAITESANATPDQVLGALDAMKQTYEPVWRNAVGDLYDAGVNGPWNVLAQMGQNAYRAELAQAIIAGEKTLTAAIPQSEKSGENINNALNLEINKVMEPYQFALGNVDGGSEALSNARSSMMLLSKSYMAKGMPAQKAVTEAARGIFPEKAYGTIILPEGTDGKAVQAYAEDWRAQFTEDDIVVPANIAANPAAALEYAKRELAEARPITSGDEIIFIGSTGKPILLKDKAERDEMGRITNPREAAMSFKIADSLTYSEEASAIAAPDSIGNLRAVVASIAGEDIKKYYSPRASVKGVDYFDSRPIVGGVGLIGGKTITRERYNLMSSSDKKTAREAIAKNAEYNKSVLALIPESGKAAFKKMLDESSKKINEILILEDDLEKKRAELIKFSDGAAGGSLMATGEEIAPINPEQEKLSAEMQEIKDRIRKARFGVDGVIGVGLQYLEVPEWAK